MRLQETIAVVTGGMGNGICDCLTREGADIFVTDLDLGRAGETVERIEQASRRGIVHQADVTSKADCQAIVDTALSAFGHIDILVNKAGHFGERLGLPLGLPLMNQTEAQWDDNYAVNVKDPFFLCKAIAPHMIERRRPAVLS